ncbi:MAG: hypothetical protein ACRELY_12470 [Polyangiaceae bacterium]
MRPLVLALLLAAGAFLFCLRALADSPQVIAPHPLAVPLRLPVTPEVAKNMVAAAWRATGLGTEDDPLDGMLARTHSSALLPEVHVRAARKIDDEIYGPTPADITYSVAYPDRVENLFEARLTWKLDRLVYSNEEPSIERLKLDRVDARARIAAHVLAVLSEWQRAWVDLHSLPEDAPASLDATMRMSDAEAALDVVTAGFFSRWRARAP